MDIFTPMEGQSNSTSLDLESDFYIYLLHDYSHNFIPVTAKLQLEFPITLNLLCIYGPLFNCAFTK